jgi:hypothetical protein
MKWLREREAVWPSSFVDCFNSAGTAYNQVWTMSAMRWALANGFTWAAANWQCQQLTPELYTGSEYKHYAVKVLAWAHKNGCPCTCSN